MNAVALLNVASVSFNQSSEYELGGKNGEVCKDQRSPQNMAEAIISRVWMKGVTALGMIFLFLAPFLAPVAQPE